MAGATDRFSTGLRFLDQQLDGGIVTGGTLALTSPPQSQAELLFSEFARETPMAYVSTLTDDPTERLSVVDPPEGRGRAVETTYRDPESILEDPEGFAATLPENAYVVLDTVDALERGSRAAYLDVLTAVKRRMRDTDGIAVLHGLKGESIPQGRSLTLKRADHVWDLRLAVGSTEISTTLCITKSRENQAFDEPLPLELSDRVRIDTSRSIA
jgi:hypothetical protein